MDPAISAIAATMTRDNQRVEIISRNIVGASGVAYQAEIPVSNAFERTLNVLSSDAPDRLTVSYLDTTQGTFRQTGRALDVAIDGPGYFRVGSASEGADTRNGAFSVDPSGRLVDGAGRIVWDVSGGEILVGAGEPEILPDGQVLVDSNVVGRIGVFGTEGLGGEDQTGEIRQGYLEASNVDVTQEMVRLLETTRHFSLASRALSAYDGILEAAIEQVTEF